MRLIVNGQEGEWVDGLTVAAFLDTAGEPPRHVVVEVNGAFVPPSRYGDVRLRAGDRIEVILPAFGG
jgi:thiamine biosynthesis protein ThiS